MKREFFNQQFAALVNAYAISNKLADESQDVYWTMLRGIPDDKFAAGVRRCLADLKWFPTIHELGEASLPKKMKTIKQHGRFFSYEQSWDEQARELNGQKVERVDGRVTKLLAEF